LQRKQASTGPHSLISNSEIQKAKKTKIFDPCYSWYRCETSVVSHCS